MNKGVWFGLVIMALVVLTTFLLLPPMAQMTSGHLGMLMLSLIVVAIMLGFPTAFTLMGMGMMFAWIAYSYDTTKTLDLMVQRTYGVMANDVLISIPLFVFMGYLVERANLIEKLFKSLHLAAARVPGSLAVATVVTCAIFATATGIVGAVVTLMGLLAFPAMLRAGYHTQLAAGADRGWLPGYSDSTLGTADCVRRHRRCFGGAIVCGCVFSRHHAGGAVYRLHHRACQDQTVAGAAVVGG